MVSVCVGITDSSSSSSRYPANAQDSNSRDSREARSYIQLPFYTYSQTLHSYRLQKRRHQSECSLVSPYLHHHTASVPTSHRKGRSVGKAAILKIKQRQRGEILQFQSYIVAECNFTNNNSLQLRTIGN